MKKKIGLTLALVFIVVFCCQHQIFASGSKKEPVEVVIMTTPFGTNMYNVGAAFEQVFKKVNSWVQIKHQETPGAMYMYKYLIKNREKMIKGEVSHTIIAGGVGILDFLAEGRRPFNKFAWPTNRTLVSNEGLTGFYVTANPDIKSLKDLAGKRVGTAERSRPFLGVLLDRPLFGRGLGIFRKIKWAALGDLACKDAFLNGKIDATRVSFGGRIEIADDGSYYFRRVAPSPPTMEILNSGKKLYWLPVEKDMIKKGYDFSKDVRSYPCVIKKGAFKGLDRDVQARAGSMCIQADGGIPDDIVEEIVRVRHEHRKQFAKYHAVLAFFPDTPYPIGSPKKYVHPGVMKAMKKLGYPLPKGVH